MRIPRTTVVTALLALALVVPACRGGEQEGLPHEARHGDHAAEAPSDLDLPLEALFAAGCEHGGEAFECGACRHEVGVARAPAALFEGGLLATVRAGPRRAAMPVRLTGEVRFDERRVAHVSSQVEGVIRRVYAALGDRVKTAQPLLEIESVLVGEAQTAHREAQGLLGLARRNHARVAELRKENIASEREYLQARQELEVAEIRVEGSAGKLARLGADGAMRGRLVLRAPMDGAILKMHAVSGEVALTGESLLTVGDNSAVWVWADLYERDIAMVRRAQAAGPLSAAVSVEAYPGEEFPGRVDLISPAMDESSRTVKVRVEVANAGGRLLAGMFAGVRLDLPGDDDVLAVPREAILEDEGRAFVFVHHHDDYYVRRPVQAGRTWDGWTEVKQGLAPDQVVVGEGAFLLKSDVLRSKMGAGCAD